MKNHSMSNPGLRGLLVFSALALGAAFAAQAQQASSPCAGRMAVAALGTDAIAAVAVATRAPSSKAQAAFRRADTNGDGKLNVHEAQHFPAMAPHFQLIDTDRDNFLSLAELSRAAS